MENRMESLRQNWFVIQQLIKRDKQRSLSSTFMGELWEIINPLINMIVMVLVFGKMFGYGIAGGFPLYVLTGTTLYGLFTSGTTMCLQALMGNKNFLIKTQLNRNVYVIQKILLAFRNFLFSLMIYAFVIALYRISPSVTWLLFIPDVFLMLIMMLGIGKILAVINVTFADITYFYKIFTLFLMYGSAIFLSAGSIITSDAEDNDYCKSTLYSYCDCKRMYYGADISRLEVVGNCKCVCRWMLSGRERLF